MAWKPKKSASGLGKAFKDSGTDIVTDASKGKPNAGLGIFSAPVKEVGGQIADAGQAAGGTFKTAVNTNIGDPAANAWHTSVVNPVRGAGEAIKNGVTDFAKHVQDMYNSARDGLKIGGPGGLGGAGGIPMVGAPGGGGYGGGMGGMNGIAGPIAADDVFRTGQMGLLTQLQNQAAGQGPSIAQNQLKMGQEAALANNLALANSARGGANPAVARAALQQNAQQGGQMTMDAANLRLQEQLQAQNALGQLTGQGRAGDLGNAQLAQQGQIAQQELAAKYAQMGMNAEQANQQAAIEIAKLQQNGALDWANLGLQSQVAQNALLGNTLQGAGGALGGLATMFSDRKLKKNVKKADAEIKEFLDSIEATSYDYKNPKHGEGRFISPMAQDLQKTRLGAQMVEKRPEGLAVNYGANLGLILAAQASLNKRLDALETK